MAHSLSGKVADITSHAGLFAWSGLKGLIDQQEPVKLLHLVQGQSHVLEMIVRSYPLPAVLEELTRVFEEQADGMVCSVLLRSEDRKHLTLGAAPSLPGIYSKAIDSLAIGPREGSCGTAAFLGRSVIVSDIAGDPLWDRYRDVAVRAGLRACWSTPIMSVSGEVLGTFDIYHRRPTAPSALHFDLIDIATHLARIAIEHHRDEGERERLWNARRFAERYRMLLEATGDVVWEWDLESGAVGWN